MFRSLCFIGFVMIAAGLNSLSAWACFMSPTHMYLSHDAAIDDAEWIAVAEAVSRTEIDKVFLEGLPTQKVPAYKMRAIEYIKGQGPDEFIVPNRVESRGTSTHAKTETAGNYFGHSVSAFWSHGQTYSHWPDCRIHPHFVFAGNRYLIFGPKDYSIGFENISLEKDRWLQYVRRRVGNENPIKPFPVSTDQYFKSAAAIVRVEASWNGQSASWKETVLKGDKPSYLNMLMISPVAQLSAELDPACREQDYTTATGFYPYSEAIDRLYVIEKLPVKDVRVNQYMGCAGPDREETADLEANDLFSTTGHRRFEISDGFVILGKTHDDNAVRNNRWSPAEVERLTLKDLTELISAD